MKCKSWAKIAHLSLVGVEPAEVKGNAPEVFDLPPGMTILHLSGINAENGEEISMCLLQPTELINKILIHESEIPQKKMEVHPVGKVKTNVTQLQATRDKKELQETAKKMMELLGL